MKHVEAFNLRLDGILRNIRWGGRLIESAQFFRIDTNYKRDSPVTIPEALIASIIPA
jgi:hypothetical protein